jgi:ABC-2 type transport system ATP-binding protein
LGLDPRGQQELLSLIRRIAAERNVGVILCSHALSEIEDICDDVIILMSGRVIASGTVTEVVNQTQRNALRIQVPSPSLAEAQQVLEALPNIIKISPADGMGSWLRIELVDRTNGSSPEGYHANNKILETLIRAEIPILGFEAEGGRLQDIFLQLTEEAVR